jgi:monovalent cation:proton antiporter-2 (CPA2) family protein
MPFLTELFVFLIAALAVVPLLNRLGLSSVIGYLVAGVIIGPSGISLVGDAEAVLHFAEIGVVLLLFIIGLELQPRRLWVMRRAVFGLGSLQVIGTTLLLAAALRFLGMSITEAALIGFSLALSSTAFVLQLLGEKKQLNSPHGRSAFGVLLFQDVAVIPVIAYLSIAGSSDGAQGGINAVAIAMVVVGLVVARFALRPLLRIVASTGIHELFIAASLALVTGSALAMYYAGLSMGLGAFIAGMLVADSEYRHQLETDVMPFKGLLLGLFFIAVGMSADLSLMVSSPLTILGLTAGLVVLKVLVLLPLAMWHGLQRAETIKTSLVLSQGGEFAFVLLTVAVSTAFIAEAYMEMAVLVVTLSMAATPFLMMAAERVLDGRQDEKDFDEMSDNCETVIIAGFGRFGQMIGRVLTTQGIAFTAMDANPGQVDVVRSYGNDVYYGDATRLDLLKSAGIADAKAIVIALEDVEASIRMTEMLTETQPHLIILARARNRQHEIKLRDLGVRCVIRDTLLSSLHLAESLLGILGESDESARRTVDMFREHDAQTLEKQAAIAHDDLAFRQTAMDATVELQQLFEDDNRGSE